MRVTLNSRLNRTLKHSVQGRTLEQMRTLAQQTLAQQTLARTRAPSSPSPHRRTSTFGANSAPSLSKPARPSRHTAASPPQRAQQRRAAPRAGLGHSLLLRRALRWIGLGLLEVRG
jgi:hypothetical protein